MTADATLTAESSPTHGSRVSEDGRARAVIDAVRPCIDGGAFPIKRVVGEPVDVEADVLADGHDHLGCVLLWRRSGDRKWSETRLLPQPNDAWRATFTPVDLGVWEYKIRAWVDPFLTWQADLRKRVDAGQNVEVDLQIGAGIVRGFAASANRALGKRLAAWTDRLLGDAPREQRAAAAVSDELADLMWEAAPRRFAVESATLTVDVDRPRALFSAWYEFFPRSASPEPGRHGTFADMERLIPYVADMGFDILYLPPIHPIGRVARKGRNNAADAAPDDVGSPWAIGAAEGGHKSVHPQLGTLADFDRLVVAAERHGLEIALDIAFQCAPDHPYVTEHPDWFRRRPDGTIQYAENPPKKYQDIVPFDFECDDWQALWRELLSVIQFWIDRGVRVFRIDNPHTKPFEFWDWLIREVRRDHPETLFLSEAFTRPKRMLRLAKGGFTQSYTYFAWRNTPAELRAYGEELTQSPWVDAFRPNFWPNTPDILTEQLQTGGRTAAMARFVLAATMSSNYGVYGPVFELSDFTPRAPGVEENLDSEKYQVRHWNLDDPWSLRHLIREVNRTRRENPALQQFRNLVFHHCDNGSHIAYSKRDADGDNVILCVVNTNPNQEEWGLVRLDLASLGLTPEAEFDVHDLLLDVRHRWRGADNLVGLPPGQSHIFRVERAGGAERDFETKA